MTKTRDTKSSKHLVLPASTTSYGVPNTAAKCGVTRLKEILFHVCMENDAEILELETMLDHVNVLVSCDPTLGIKR